MESIFIQILTFLYGTVAVVSMLAYVPQIYNLIISTGRSEAVSISSWILWFFTASIGLLYVIFITYDFMLVLVYAINVLGVVLVLSLTIYNRYFRFSVKLPYGVSADMAEKIAFKNITKI